MKEFVRLSMALFVSCIIAAIALSIIQMITAKPIAKQNRLAELKAVSETLPPYDNDPVEDKKNIKVNGIEKTIYIGKKQNSIVGIAFEENGLGYSGKIAVMIGITPDGAVSGIRIRSQQETPGLGAKIVLPDFYDQFKGLSLSLKKGLVKGLLAVDKDGGTIDSITGATISSRGVTQAVNKALLFFNDHKKEILG